MERAQASIRQAGVHPASPLTHWGKLHPPSGPQLSHPKNGSNLPPRGLAVRVPGHRKNQGDGHSKGKVALGNELPGQAAKGPQLSATRWRQRS